MYINVCVHGCILKRWYKRSTQGDNIELLMQGNRTKFSILKHAKPAYIITLYLKQRIRNCDQIVEITEKGVK